MDKVKQLVNAHYEENLKESFYESEIAKGLMNKGDVDWESSFFIWHRPTSNINEIHNLSENLRYDLIIYNYN
jgi:aminocyclopropanecarboxylate oxidase